MVLCRLLTGVSLSPRKNCIIATSPRSANGSESLVTLCTCRNISKMHNPGQECRGPLWDLKFQPMATHTCTEQISINYRDNSPVAKLPSIACGIHSLFSILAMCSCDINAVHAKHTITFGLTISDTVSVDRGRRLGPLVWMPRYKPGDALTATGCSATNVLAPRRCTPTLAGHFDKPSGKPQQQH